MNIESTKLMITLVVCKIDHHEDHRLDDNTDNQLKYSKHKNIYVSNKCIHISM
jgi:hypothetical protein